jgi:pilus assembly protein Flp/PilA
MLIDCKRRLATLIRDEEGASLVEYVLLVALIAVVCIAAVTLLGRAAKGKFEITANSINGAS